MNTTPPQHMTALARANKIRLARAELKRQIRRGEVSVADILTPGRKIPFGAKSMPVAQLLASQKRWGTERTRSHLVPLAISELRKVGDLTKRERQRIVDAIDRNPKELRDERLLAA